MTQGVTRWGLSDGFRLARTVGQELKNSASYTSEEFLMAAERALKKHPDEWVVHYSLADKYQDLGYYENGLKSAQRCVELKPNDIRSTYALATSYYILTRASWNDKEDEVGRILSVLIPGLGKTDKRYSQAGLDRIGLVVDTAATQAIRWFEKCLTLRPDKESRTSIMTSLNTLYQRFPHLRN